MAAIRVREESLNFNSRATNREFVMALSVSSKVTKTIGAATLLAVAGLFALPGLARAQEETWTQTSHNPSTGAAILRYQLCRYHQPDLSSGRSVKPSRSSTTMIAAGNIVGPLQGCFRWRC